MAWSLLAIPGQRFRVSDSGIHDLSAYWIPLILSKLSHHGEVSNDIQDNQACYEMPSDWTPRHFIGQNAVH